MRIIDSHQHFWKYDPVNYDWISDDMQLIRRDFLPQDLARVLQHNEVSGCVAVQAEQTEAETLRLLAYAEDHSFINGVVGWVDLRAADIAERLLFFSQHPKLKGFRHVLQGEEPAFMLQPAFLEGISLLQKNGFAYDILVFPHHLTAVMELVAKFPQQRFVIDHLAKPYIRSGEIDGWRNDMKQLAAFPNLYCKVSGMVTEADWKHWSAAALRPYFDVAFEAFGSRRLMFGSDWPVCLVASSYAGWLNMVRSFCEELSEAEQHDIFADNARRFYHL